MQQVHLNVGGHLHTTSLATLKAVASSGLADTFAGSWKLRRTGSGEVFIDRDGEAFGIILQYLRAERDSRLFDVPCLSKDKLAQLKVEADYYGLTALHDIISAGPSQHQMHEETAQFLGQAVRSRRFQFMTKTSSDAWPASLLCTQDPKAAAGAERNLTSDLEILGLLKKLGGLHAVVAALKSPSDHVQEQATGTLWYLSKEPAVQGQLRQLGALPTLIAYLSSANVAAQENAAGIMHELTQLEGSHREIVGLKGHDALPGHPD
ncbi:hypothetical protein WJX84_007893 [Apatococcus fuscideae]|uniref:Potassium channel tetramerisation-type BTB domain-containing protein n=1 Tax=Apatococcus fuscideae TaxID=2026836 RepID=A0AAW1SVW3_9CHLO